MRGRVKQERSFRWGRPRERNENGETLRGAELSNQLRGAVYPLPASQSGTERGLIPEEGILLILPPDSGLKCGDLLRAEEDGAPLLEAAEVREYPTHREAVLRARLTDGEGELYD